MGTIGSASSPSPGSRGRGPSPPAGRIVAGVLAVALAGSAAGRPAQCSDQAAELLPKLEPLIVEFKEERQTALSTPRISLAAQISKLRAVQRKTRELAEWPEASCGFRLQEKLDAAEAFDIRRLEAFMSGSSDAGAAKARELWAEADRQLRALQDLARATKRD